MNIFKYDGSFDGLLCCVFDSFKHKIIPDLLVRDDGGSIPLFYDALIKVETRNENSLRVWKALNKIVTRSAASAVATAFLCDNPDFDIGLFRFMRDTFRLQKSIEHDFSNPDVLDILKNCRKVRGEAHRIIQFLRFQKVRDGSYYGAIEPLYDVLPMVVEHFRDRFSDESFTIYDLRRDYGYYCEMGKPNRIHLESTGLHLTTGDLPDEMKDPSENVFRELWRTYFRNVAIKERTNSRKQRQDMPVRFWKHLTEKTHT